uniref:RNA helicase n=1 Tax=Mus musculus TaxID=10090 RepID=Q8R4Z5_MOUSE|nr:DEAD-box corepressor DP103 beta [Mus musculus]
MAAAAFEVPAALTTSESTMAAERAAAPVQAVEPTPASPWTQRTAHDIGGPRTRTGDVVLAEPADFESLLLSRPVLEGLRAAGFERPSPVQLKAIPLGRCGLDLIVQAKSGTGKTCVFSTIALDSLILENYSTQILILAPTREIAVQIHSVITAIGIKMEGLECHVFIGGTPLSQDKTRLKKCHIAVGSPGRIKQLIELDYLNPGSIRLFILDEADKLLEEGSFQEQINWIYSSLPASKQMLAVSATYPEVLANALTRYMRDPTFVRLNPSDPSLIGLKQYYQVVNSYPLAHKIFEEKTQHLQELFSKVPFNQALVFSEDRAQMLVSSSQSGDSESDSDSCSSRTSSQSKGNKSYLEGSSDTQLKDTECTPVGGPLSLEQVQNGNDTPTQVEYQEAPETQVKARHKEGANQRSKQSRRNPARRSSYRVQSEPQEESWYDCHRETTASFSDTYQDYEEYWRAYYRAWQEYYAAASHSYYWNAQRHPSWMAAYHMNTVYLQEMMRGNQ